MRKVIYFLYAVLSTLTGIAQLPHHAKTKIPVVKGLAGVTPGKVMLVAENGKSYVVIVSKGSLEDSGRIELANPPCNGETFDGTDRRASKTSFSNASVVTYQTLTALYNTLIPDHVIGQHNPPISTGPQSPRVPEEQRNVDVKQAWIYTFSREGDEDFHTIIGNTAHYTAATIFMNIEISGLPPIPNSSTARITTVRNTFKKFFGLTASCQGGYVNTFPNPVQVEFQGSLFFDELHFQQQAIIGHGVAIPKTYWEVHPVSMIKFL